MTPATLSTPTDREIVVVRSFAAPRALVWDAMTKFDLLKQWLNGPPGWSMTACNGELTVGAWFRWAWRGPDDQEMIMRGVNLEVIPLERIVRTESFECGCDPQSSEKIGTLVLTDPDGGGDGPGCRSTQFSLSLLYPTKAARDATLASGMANGMAMGYDRLDAILSLILSRQGIRDAA
jgi:uncharacterized protein YndB with AHSA1/START domain